jgi:ribosomal subunit interface protein
VLRVRSADARSCWSDCSSNVSNVAGDRFAIPAAKSDHVRQMAGDQNAPATTQATTSSINIEITARGDVDERARERARQRLADVERFVKRPILGARVVLIQESNPRISLPARAEAEIDLQGRSVRARVAAPSMEAAVDAVAERLQRHVHRYVERLVTREREPAEALVGEWSHRSWSSPRPSTFARPVQEREIIRRKSFAFGPMSVDQAADALEDLDHDFFLFHDAKTDADAIVYWRDDDLLALIEPASVQAADNRGPIHERNRFSSPIELQAAVAEMNAVSHRFLFFENAADGRGNVIYRRYDGHYGLIEPA